MKTLLRNRDFRLLWLGQFCSQFGDRLTQMILVALAASREPGSSLVLAKVLAATSLPVLLVGPLAGVYVDRWDRKRTMILCDLLRCALIFFLPWLALGASRLPLYLNIFLLYAVASFFVPARLAIIPTLVPPDRMAKANALFTTSGMIGSAVILVVGALLVEWVGTTRSCWINAAAYAASAAWILPIVRRAEERAKKRLSIRRIVWEILEGIRELWAHSTTRRVIGLLGLLVAGAAASTVVAATLVQRWLGTITKDLGFLSLWCGVGMFLGTVAFGRWGVREPRRKILAFSFLGAGAAMGFFLMAVTVVRSGVAGSAAAGLLGFCVAPAGIIANTLVHEAYPKRLHGRIFSSFGIVVNVSLIGSMLTAGWIADRTGAERFLSAIGLAFALAGAALLYYGYSRTKKESSS